MTHIRPSWDVLVFGMDIHAPTTAQTVQNLRFQCNGTIVPVKQVEQIRLYEDADQSRDVSAGDSLIYESPVFPISNLELEVTNLSAAIPAGATRSFLLTFDLNNYPGEDQNLQVSLVSVEAYPTGVPGYSLFSDGMEQPNAAWSIIDDWARSNEEAYSGDFAWSDSPGGNYVSNNISTLILNSIDLGAARSSSLFLQFVHYYETEEGVDFCRLEIAQHGSNNWTELASYTGESQRWRHASLPLANWAGTLVDFRFRLISDIDIEKDGWHIDDVNINALIDSLSSPLKGAIITLEEKLPVLQVSSYSLAATTTFTRGTQKAPVLGVQVMARNYDLDLTTLAFTAESPQNEAQEIWSARMYRDNNGDGKRDPGEPPVGVSAAFPADHGTLWAGAFEPVSSMEEKRFQLSAEVLNNRIYAIGGSDSEGHNYHNSVEYYDPESGKWTSIPPMNSSRVKPRTVVLNDRIYVLDANSEVYDPTQNQWSRIAPMKVSRFDFEVVAMRGKIYTLGGAIYTGDPYPWYYTPLTDCEVYDPAGNTWTILPSMIEARSKFGAVVLHDRIYAIGGAGTTCEVYDPDTNSWSSLPPILNWQENVNQVLVMNGLIYVLGYLPQVYNPATNNWTDLASINIGRSIFQAIPFLDRIYAFGGYKQSSAEFYDPLLNKWFVLPSMSTTREWSQAEALDNKVFVMGGNEKSSVEAFTPDVGKLYQYLPVNIPVSLLLTFDWSDWPSNETAYFTPQFLSSWARAINFPEYILTNSIGGATGEAVLLPKVATLNSTIHPLPDGISYPRGSTLAEVLSFTLRSSNYGTHIQSMTFRSAGSGHERDDIRAARLWQDSDASRNVSPGDIELLAPQVYTQDDGSLNFNFNNSWLSIPITNETSFLLAYDFTAQPGPAGYFTARIDRIQAEALEYPGQPVQFNGATAGPEIKLRADIVTPTPTIPGGATPTPSRTPIPFEAIDLNNDGIIDYLDLLLVAERWHETINTPTP